ncbi:hypothetical protein PIB30_022492 [Stylosanthes scabra]|uniref:Uncharacterized protein n=1 Tax=Stylosanthes scabra TaxID=79078 RepID=A0ABU6U873_9FABA|nr:hypothetical protein [Stylosanthes scabra]
MVSATNESIRTLRESTRMTYNLVEKLFSNRRVDSPLDRIDSTLYREQKIDFGSIRIDSSSAGVDSPFMKVDSLCRESIRVRVIRIDSRDFQIDSNTSRDEGSLQRLQ